MNLDDRITALEHRLRNAEDHLEILNLLNSYGPLVDGGDSAEAANLWINGGGYTFSGVAGEGRRLEAPTGLLDAYATNYHQDLIRNGSAHITAAPILRVDGDEAEALGYSFVVSRDEQSWIVHRAAINRWTLRRTQHGWRVVERINELLTGSSRSHELLRQLPGAEVRPREAAD